MAGSFESLGLHLERADLNEPSFSRLTFTGALGVIDRMTAAAPEAPWVLYGSSMGGYLAARWAELNPERVERLVLLCPGFNLIERWPEIVGVDEMAQWKAQGWWSFPDAEEVPTALHYAFVTDCMTHPPFPEVRCPTLIIHGSRDETVPIESSRVYAEARPNVRLVEVDDDHSLTASLPDIEALSLDFLGLGSGR